MPSLEQIYDRSPAWAQTLLMNAHALRIRRHRYGAPYRAAVERLEAQERWGRAELERWRDERIRAVVHAAYAGSPYYRRVLDAAGVRPGDVRGAADLALLPVLTRETVRAEGTAMCTRPSPGRGWLAGCTSGTTGTPLR
ncbi:MAG TPA: hypothetical protein VFR81_10110, partial [Longimicrobium sp.]|nr:hypothetical protein [Longimicrobium sp.]